MKPHSFFQVLASVTCTGCDRLPPARTPFTLSPSLQAQALQLLQQGEQDVLLREQGREQTLRLFHEQSRTPPDRRQLPHPLHQPLRAHAAATQPLRTVLRAPTAHGGGPVPVQHLQTAPADARERQAAQCHARTAQEAPDAGLSAASRVECHQVAAEVLFEREAHRGVLQGSVY